MNLHRIFYLPENKGFSLLSDILNSIECSFLLAMLFMILLVISLFMFCFQNQILRFLVFFHTRVLNSAYLVPSWDLYRSYCYIRQDFREAQSIACFVLVFIVCFTMLNISLMSSVHRATVFRSIMTTPPNPQVRVFGPNSQFFYWLLLCPSIKWWNSSKLCPRLSSCLPRQYPPLHGFSYNVFQIYILIQVLASEF